jgi:hypothetical protein
MHYNVKLMDSHTFKQDRQKMINDFNGPGRQDEDPSFHDDCSFLIVDGNDIQYFDTAF